MFTVAVETYRKILMAKYTLSIVRNEYAIGYVICAPRHIDIN